jgi:hypothetical protein
MQEADTAAVACCSVAAAAAAATAAVQTQPNVVIVSGGLTSEAQHLRESLWRRPLLKFGSIH